MVGIEKLSVSPTGAIAKVMMFHIIAPEMLQRDVNIPSDRHHRRPHLQEEPAHRVLNQEFDYTPAIYPPDIMMVLHQLDQDKDEEPKFE